MIGPSAIFTPFTLLFFPSISPWRNGDRITQLSKDHSMRARYAQRHDNETRHGICVPRDFSEFQLWEMIAENACDVLLSLLM